MAHLGELIAELRQDRGLTQKELGDILCVSSGTISNYENGVTLPPLERMIALATIFDCDVAYLLGDYSKEKKDNSDICDMTGLSEKAVSRLLLYKSQYSDNVDSLNFLLESDNLEDVLYHMLKRSFKEQLKKNKK